jgi:hypothetical protein
VQLGDRLADGQLEFLKARPLYPFAMWTTRLWLVAAASMVVLTVADIVGVPDAVFGTLSLGMLCTTFVLGAIATPFYLVLEEQLINVLEVTRYRQRVIVSWAVTIAILLDAAQVWRRPT